jgi:hypothetical protein
MITHDPNFTFDPKIWGGHYWFMLHTIVMCYPLYPNSETKKKYYDFFHNLPLFIPNEQSSTYFTKLMQKYPIAPYLDNRKLLIKWLHFIHNKINISLEKPTISLHDFYAHYYEQYKSIPTKNKEFNRLKEKFIFFSVLFLLISVIYYFYVIVP